MLVLAALVYSAALFLIAYRVERRGMSARAAKLAYPLSLAVYFTSWTFFGAVGTATTTGWNYLAIFLGPALVFLLAPAFLKKLVAIVQAEHSNSIADFISARYGRSQAIGSIVALFALLASIPYIALQLRSVSRSFGAIAGLDPSALIGGAVAIALALFAISFGARRYEVSGRNEGVIAAIAVESAVKLLALLVLGLFALMQFAGAPDVARQAGLLAFETRFGLGEVSVEFFVQTALSAAAILCLPRQFHVMAVQAPDADAVQRSRWPFLAYLFLVSAAVVPLAVAGLTLLPGAGPPDLYVLNLPLAAGSSSIALLAFLGGLSAATAMVIVETLALSTMAANNLLAPLLLRGRGTRTDADLGRKLLLARRATIIAITAAAFVYSEGAGDERTLASIGLIAFAGVAQFAPALIATVAFDFDDARAIRAGLLGGVLLWFYTLFLPSIGGLPVPAGSLLHPYALFGLELGSPIVHGALWSLGANVLLLLLVGRFDRPSLGVEPNRRLELGHVKTIGELKSLVGRFVGEAEADEAIVGRKNPHAPIDGRTARRAERLIAGVIGAPSARLIVTSTMAGSSLEIGDVVRLLDEGGRSLQFSKSLLSATLQALDPGVSVVDRNLRLVAWNRRYLEMFEFPEGFVYAGQPVAELIRYNAERGEWGQPNVEELVQRRLERLRRGQPHSFERRRPSGRWIKTAGGPMPGGGYVMSFTDITEQKAAQEELEARVEERTRDLERSNLALEEARRAAERATSDKTRFLAAASHDLLQPLHAARLFCSALDHEADERVRPLVRNIDRAIGSADSLLRALLDVSKLDAGGIVPKPEKFRIDELIEELRTDFDPLAAERGLRLGAYSTGAVVETDRHLLRSILQNFLSNAVRYTAAGGIFIGARRRGQEILVEVRDSGPGIAREDQARIFAEFERLETKGSAGSGVGLGLAIVERVSRLIGVPVALRSAPGEGSTFSVRLRAVEAGGALPLPAGRASVEQASGQRVLCLDNDEHVLAGLEAALRSRGCTALIARTAEEAIERAKTDRPDFALLDLHLGEPRDGLDVAAAIRAADPDLPIALVTADKTVGADRRAKLLDLIVLSKPLDPERLWAFLRCTRAEG